MNNSKKYAAIARSQHPDRDAFDGFDAWPTGEQDCQYSEIWLIDMWQDGTRIRRTLGYCPECKRGGRLLDSDGTCYGCAEINRKENKDETICD